MKHFTYQAAIALALGLGLTIGFVWLLGTGSLPVARASTYTVNNTNASGPGSLRQAILDANANNGHDIIDFAPSVNGTIALTSTLPLIDDDLTVTGPGSGILSISGDNAYRVLKIASSTVVTISDLTIRDGNATDDLGGGIHNEGALLLDTVDVVSNTANGGAGIYIGSGSATLSETQIISNVATGIEASGGGLYLESGSVTLEGGQIAHNTASDGGGGVYVRYGTFIVNEGQILSNTCTALETAGGGVYVYEGNATLNGGEIAHNAATYGGGVYVRENSASFTQTGGAIFHNAGYWGGGVFADQGSATLSGGQIISNTADSGGGVYVYQGSATLSGGQIVSNTADSGGGVYVDASSAAFTQTSGSVIAHNVASGTTIGDGGGGVYVNWGNATLSGGQVVSNTASNDGGGVYVHYGSATLERGQIIDNKVNDAGGGAIIRSSFASLNVNRGQIVGNTALIGGGLYNRGGTLILVNTTVSHNTASVVRGGGLFSEYSSATSVLTYTTVASNTAASGGGGIYVTGGGLVLLQNSIVAYNGTANCNGGVTSNGHNLEYGNTCNLTATTDITDKNPLLGPLTYDHGTLVHPLLEGSPAIDAGICISGITIDQRGVPRIAPCDIGAYEWAWQKVYLPLVLRNH